jgi:tRNA-dihydrouridine synthase
MAIKKVMNIPVVLNGGIADYADYERYSSNNIGIRADCGRRAMRDTQVDGVMTSEAVLENPALFR